MQQESCQSRVLPTLCLQSWCVLLLELAAFAERGQHLLDATDRDSEDMVEASAGFRLLLFFACMERPLRHLPLLHMMS